MATSGKEKLREFMHKVRTFGMEAFDRYYASYKGEVVRNDDPEGRGRVIVRVPALQLDSDAPVPQWAMPKGGAFNRNEGRGVVDVPDEGDQVWVEFQEGDPNQPIYTPAGFFAEGDLPDEFEVPNDRGWKTHAGHVVRFRDADGDESILIEHANGGRLEWKADDKIEVVTSGGDTLRMDPSGSVELEHRGGPRYEMTSSKVTAETPSGSRMALKPGTAEIASNAQVTVKSKRVLVAGSASIELGKGAISPLVKGDVLSSWLTTFFTWAVGHIHGPHLPPIVGPSLPPLVPPPPPPVPAMLSVRSRTV